MFTKQHQNLPRFWSTEPTVQREPASLFLPLPSPLKTFKSFSLEPRVFFFDPPPLFASLISPSSFFRAGVSFPHQQMIFSRGFSRISRTSTNRALWLFSARCEQQQSVSSNHLHSPRDTTEKAVGCRENYSLGYCSFHGVGHQIHHQSSSIVEEHLDPFTLVENELSILANRLRSMVVAEVPKLASAAEYFFKMGVEGKRFRPTVLLLMATALNASVPGPASDGVVDALALELRRRQQRIAEITEMIHVASLLHDDVLDDADTRRGIGSLNFVMGNKLAVLAGDFLLSRACVALASLKNTEVVSLLATVVEHLVTGETMQMTTTSEQRCSMEYYLQKTYYKTASLISNSCKAIALLAGQSTEVSLLAYEYGKNLGLAFQLIDDILDFTGTSTLLGKGSLSDIRHGIITAPLLYAMEEFPPLRAVVDRGLDNPADVDLALEYLEKSRGIQRTRELAAKHANLASAAIDSLPESDDEDVQRSRRALVDLTHRVITRTK
ncbi:Solanesyl diphosphate synthase 3, chloroplastic/mitochondrial [Sarracenia purpurea var. burkii]